MRFLSVNVLLRAAAIVSLLYCLGHMSGLPWAPGESDAARAVVAQMQAVRFEAMGVSRSYWDFYFGFGLIVGVFLAAQALVLWCLGTLAQPDARRLVPLLAALLV